MSGIGHGAILRGELTLLGQPEGPLPELVDRRAG